ncbi:MAG: hypothetical protein KDA58_01680 [Planctomycetaceae bacterium]|nr:hypothetical protein [Planctomycetaceae bacterium]
MRIVRPLTLLVLLVCGQQAVCQQQSFPYQASVAVDDVEVRCGPGQRYYITSKLAAGTQITVHRHDHGGWFMIAPPPGSFSWIATEHVDRQGDQGVIRIPPTAEGLPGRVIVRIGSELSDEHSFYGRELSDGDTVRILGEETLVSERGVRAMLKIVPPAQEFRWVKGDFVVPVDATVRREQANDPYQIPPQHRHRLSRDVLTVAGAQPAKLEEPKSPELTELDARLARIDQAYAEMMNGDPSTWDLDGMAAQYRTLLTEGEPKIQARVDQRLRVIDSRRSVHEQYRKFVQITTQTNQRDAQLTGMQTTTPLIYGNLTNSVGTTVASTPGLPAGDVSAQAPTSSIPEQTAALSGPLTDDVQPQLNGAGIVTPIGIAGLPPYALIAPDGKFLTYLEPSDPRQLQQWVGKEAGIIGNRQFDRQFGADVIQVRRVTAVQLVR